MSQQDYLARIGDWRVTGRHDMGNSLNQWQQKLVAVQYWEMGLHSSIKWNLCPNFEMMQIVILLLAKLVDRAVNDCVVYRVTSVPCFYFL